MILNERFSFAPNAKAEVQLIILEKHLKLVWLSWKALRLPKRRLVLNVRTRSHERAPSCQNFPEFVGVCPSVSQNLSVFARFSILRAVYELLEL